MSDTKDEHVHTTRESRRDTEGMLSSGKKRFWIFFFGMFVTALVVAILTSVVTTADNTSKINDRSETNTVAITSADKTLKIIRGCLTPGRRCYEAGKAQQVAQDGQHLSAVIAAQFCGDKLMLENPEGYTHRQIVACVGTIMDGSRR